MTVSQPRRSRRRDYDRWGSSRSDRGTFQMCRETAEPETRVWTLSGGKPITGLFDTRVAEPEMWAPSKSVSIPQTRVPTCQLYPICPPPREPLVFNAQRSKPGQLSSKLGRPIEEQTCLNSASAGIKVVTAPPVVPGVCTQVETVPAVELRRRRPVGRWNRKSFGAHRRAARKDAAEYASQHHTLHPRPRYDEELPYSRSRMEPSPLSNIEKVPRNGVNSLANRVHLASFCGRSAWASCRREPCDH